MATEERGRKGGQSFTGKYDTETKTARPTSVGPHHARDKQEDPANPGIKPEEGYGHEIAEVNKAAQQGSRSAEGPLAPAPKAEGSGEKATQNPGPPRDAPPLTSTAGD